MAIDKLQQENLAIMYPEYYQNNQNQQESALQQIQRASDNY